MCEARLAYPGEEPPTDINDVRNGILLCADGDQHLGKHLFLVRIPNPYLTAANLHRDTSDSHRVDRLPYAQFMFHWLEPPVCPVIDPTFPRMQIAPERKDRLFVWGASAVLDFVFGCGFLHLFGTPDRLELTTDLADKEYGAIKQEAIQEQQAKQEQQEKASAERAKAKRRGPNPADGDDKLTELQDRLDAFEELRKGPGHPAVVEARLKQEAQIKAIEETMFAREVEEKRPEIEAWARSVG
ncbi:hypothetical protein B0H10DRAFT_1947377 [Mycena sp. CBHHK59/15]|nr:hypothetical protein B0H10DRAFT_1947377 [Mycena sp. CBHHK59/15]